MKIGAVSYLNTKPLVHGLSDLIPDGELSFDLPSRLADGLSTRVLDVALIPSIEFLRHPGYTIVSDACIGCRGPVLSVKLFSRVPLEAIKTLALDEGSRTSAALVQIMLLQQHGVRPDLYPLPIGSGLADADSDAVLLIGDRAIRTPPGPYEPVWDLGEVWVRTFERPFVFAVWAAAVDLPTRLGAASFARLANALRKARDRGVAAIQEIAAEQHATVGLSIDQCVHYLRSNLHFKLSPRELEGLELFRRKALQLDLLEHDTTIRISHAGDAQASQL